jgi:hypothetical protein
VPDEVGRRKPKLLLLLARKPQEVSLYSPAAFLLLSLIHPRLLFFTPRVFIIFLSTDIALDFLAPSLLITCWVMLIKQRTRRMMSEKTNGSPFARICSFLNFIFSSIFTSSFLNQ